MEGSWWRSREELDEEQEKIIKLPIDGRFLIVGPPGCGKTNLLVLRAAYLAKKQFQDLVVLTFTGSLVDFIRTGVPAPIVSQQVNTHIGWLRSIVRPRIKTDVWKTIEAVKDMEEQREQLALEFLKLIGSEDVSNIHQAIFVDEVQDFLASELRAVTAAASRVTIAGDSRQSIYAGSALGAAPELGFTEVRLKRHYRIGQAIAKIADKLIEPECPEDSLLASSQYDESKMASNADLLQLSSRDEQFSAMESQLMTQLSAYPKEKLAILVPKKETLAELRHRVSASSLKGCVSFHDDLDDEGSFLSKNRIHAMTIAASKGTEFRAAHLYSCEEAQWPQVSRRFWYTAVTRAKTSLTAYASPGPKPLSKRLVAAFAEEADPEIDSLFI